MILPEDPSEPPEPRARPIQTPASVLLLVDHPASLKLMVYLLVSAGYHPWAATNGRDGLDRAREMPPDLIVCDVNLPQAEEMEVIRALKQHPTLCHVPILALSPRSSPDTRDKLVALGFKDCLSRPIDPLTFIAQLESHLPTHQRSARPEPRAAVALHG